MNAALIGILSVLCPAAVAPEPAPGGQPIIETDFSKGTFASLGWEVKGDWDVYRYPIDKPTDPGSVARFAANKPDGTLTRAFPEIRNPRSLSLALDYGWGWGSADQGSDSVGFMLLDARGNGYVFEVHRTRAKWAVQWGKVSDETPAGEKSWASDVIDATHLSVRDGGGLSRITINRESDGTWTIRSKEWNQSAGGSVRFSDATTASFSRVVLLGTKNFDEQVFNKIVLTAGGRELTDSAAIPAADFLDSIGINTTFPDRGQPLPKTVQMIKYGGFRWVRGGIEGLSEGGPTTLQTYLDLHQQTGVRFSWGLVSGGTDLKKLIETAKPLAEAGALLAFEGNNEPNNWGVNYQGEPGGGRAPTWLAVAKLQRDLYRAVKDDPTLKRYPVWSTSENGGEVDNVGLQFLAIPEGAGATLPAGTRFADYANVHNYIYHPGSPGLADNKTWNASDPTSACRVDGLYGNYGLTWAKHFRGYSEEELIRLPRVTTETGCTVDGPVTEEIQARNLLTLYLDQFKRGWSHTAVYLLRDRTDEGGNQSFGFFRRDYTARKAAVYLHNLTTILADRDRPAESRRLKYAVPEIPATVHELLLQKADGTFALVVWNERLKGNDEVTVQFSDAHEIKVYDPTVGTEPIKHEPNADALKLTLSDHPLVVMIGQR